MILVLNTYFIFITRRETYGPFTRNYHRPSTSDGTVTDADTHIMARQGHSFVTADEVRVVYQHQEGEPFNAPLRDVPADGRTLGEVVVRGNIVMKEVRLSPAGMACAVYSAG